MMKLVNDTDPILRTRADEWNFDTDLNAVEVEQEMIDLMQASKGVGLAANQVGLLKRVFVIQLKHNLDFTEPFAMFNPRLISSSNEVASDFEGCLSFPDLWLEIKRAQKIEVNYLDKDQKECTMLLTGPDARCFLHELDHLDGVCFTNKVSQLKLALAKKKQRKYNGRTK